MRNEKIRLDKFLSNLGYGSRKQIKKYAKDGKVKINDTVINDSSTHINPENDVIIYNDEQIYYSKFKYVVMNKPSGYISATSDPIHKVVTEFLDANLSRYNLSPAGRLDKDTEGLLILTNDGEFIHNIISPGKSVFKTYYVETESPLSHSDITTLEKGIFLVTENHLTKPAKIKKLDECKYELSIMEGKFHQVKRMMIAVHNRVKYLKRISIGNYKLPENLAPGEFIEVKYTDLLPIFNNGL